MSVYLWHPVPVFRLYVCMFRTPCTWVQTVCLYIYDTLYLCPDCMSVYLGHPVPVSRLYVCIFRTPCTCVQTVCLTVGSGDISRNCILSLSTAVSQTLNTECPNKHGNRVKNTSLLRSCSVIPDVKCHNVIMNARIYFRKTVKGCNVVNVPSWPNGAKREPFKRHFCQFNVNLDFLHHQRHKFAYCPLQIIGSLNYV